jgi:Icc protein
MYFVQISDTHFGQDGHYEVRGVNTANNAMALVQAVNSLPINPEFIIHTGDVVDSPSNDAYGMASRVLSQLHAPLYHLPGNHDSSLMQRNSLKMSSVDRWLDDTSMTYAFERSGVKFIVLDGRGPDSIDPQGLMPDASLEFCKEELVTTKGAAVIFQHFPALPLRCAWIDRKMLLQNGEELHMLLSGFRDKILGVFHGHIHQSMQHVRDGILYISAPSSVYQLHAFPGDEEPNRDDLGVRSFNLVHVSQRGMLVRQHAY